MFFPSGTGPLGLQFGTWDVRVINKTGSTITKGDLLQFDFYNTSGAATSWDFGGTNSVYAIVVQPNDVSTAGITSSAYKMRSYCIALEDISANLTGPARVAGKVKEANVQNPTLSTAVAGTGLHAGTSSSALQAELSTARASVVAILEQDLAASTTAIRPILFNGAANWGVL